MLATSGLLDASKYSAIETLRDGHRIETRALRPQDREDLIAAVSRTSSEPGQAEVAFTVVDKYQGRGLGAALLRHLAMIARQAGLRELVAYVLSDNRAMLKVLEKSGLKYTAKREAGTVYVKLGLT